jgi:putative tryptophan/tyrosine transport system substrate-binding protein
MKRRAFITGLGAVAAWPLSTKAQQRGATPVVGFLSARSAADSADVEAAFRKGLNETGYIDNTKVRIVHRWADGRFDRLPQLAAELLEQRVTAIAAVGGDMTVRAAKAATGSIPIIMVTGTDPAKTGLVASLNKPGANVTGVTLYSEVVEPKRVEILRELVPGAARLALLLNPNDPVYRAKREAAEGAARALAWPVQAFDASVADDIDRAFGSFGKSEIGAVLVSTSPFFSTQRHQIIALANRHKIPAIFDSRIQVSEGGLISYGTSYADTYRQAGVYTGRVLKGEKPGDLPVLLPTKFELAINLKTAKALGLTVPPKLLFTADEVIE